MRRLLITAFTMLSGYLLSFGQQVIPLYSDSIPNSIGAIPENQLPTLTVYQPAKEKANGHAIIVIPGGAYAFLATGTEGTPIARAFADSGYSAFVLKYRLPSDRVMRDKSIGPLQDAQAAIKYVRLNASIYGIDTSKVGIIGYSAGGHLASTLGTHYQTSYIPNTENISLRPAYMILVYPVISMDNPITHRGSRINLLGNDPSMEKVIQFSNEDQVTANTPPTYITHTDDDAVVSVENSNVFYKALVENKVYAELHLYPKGNHGFTQRWPVSDWLNPMLRFIRSLK